MKLINYRVELTEDEIRLLVNALAVASDFADDNVNDLTKACLGQFVTEEPFSALKLWIKLNGLWLTGEALNEG